MPPLPLPDLAALPADAAGVARALADSPALALFDQRARAVDADFALSAGDAAGRRRAVPPPRRPAAGHRAGRRPRRPAGRPDALLAHLAQHLDALGDGPRDLPERQQTLRGAIDWSYALLDPDERRAVRRARRVRRRVHRRRRVRGRRGRRRRRPASAQGELAWRLTRLAEQEPARGRRRPGRRRARYRMLETIRAYAAARLPSTTAPSRCTDRHARATTSASPSARRVGLTGPEQADWADRLEREYQNLRAAIDWALSRDDVTSAAQVCLGLWRYWRNGEHIRRGPRVAGPGARRRRRPVPDAPRGPGCCTPAAVLAATQDDHERALPRSAARACACAGATGDRHDRPPRRTTLWASPRSTAATTTGPASTSGRAWPSGRSWSNAPGTAIALGNLTKVSLRLGDIAAADQFAGECLALERAAGNTRGHPAWRWSASARSALAQGDVAGARAALEESLALSRTLGDVFGEAMALHQLGLAAHADGDRTEALRPADRRAGPPPRGRRPGGPGGLAGVRGERGGRRRAGVRGHPARRRRRAARTATAAGPARGGHPPGGHHARRPGRAGPAGVRLRARRSGAPPRWI